MTLLLKSGADPNIFEKVTLLTPLHFACRHGHHKCALSLLLSKADASARDYRDYTPLHHASDRNHTEVIELLLSAGAGVSSVIRSDGHTSLFFATRSGNVEAVELLIEAGADPNKLDAHGRNALFFVHSVEVLKVLLNRGASAKIRDRHGQTPLHCRGFFGSDAGVLCALYEAGVDPTVLSVYGQTAADLARVEQHENAARMIDLLIAKHQSLS